LFIKADKDWVKNLINKVKQLLSKNDMMHRDKDEALISKKQVEAKCGSCDVRIDDLKGVKSD